MTDQLVLSPVLAKASLELWSNQLQVSFFHTKTFLSIIALGVLDFATGTATIIREKTEYRIKSEPNRPSRLLTGINGGLPLYNENYANAQNMLREIDPNSKNPLFCVEKVKSDLLLFITSKSVLLYGENFEEHLNVSYSNMRQVVEYKNRLILDLDNNIRYFIVYNLSTMAHRL